jgi:hypothetical protein
MYSAVQGKLRSALEGFQPATCCTLATATAAAGAGAGKQAKVVVSGAHMAAGLELCRLSKLLLIAGGWVLRRRLCPLAWTSDVGRGEGQGAGAATGAGTGKQAKVAVSGAHMAAGLELCRLSKLLSIADAQFNSKLEVLMCICRRDGVGLRTSRQGSETCLRTRSKCWICGYPSTAGKQHACMRASVTPKQS